VNAKTSTTPEQAKTSPGSTGTCCTCYLVRHGDTRQDQVRRYIGQTDLPLNVEGRAQARALQKHLVHIPFTRICSSDLRRCMETARIIAGPQGKSIRKLPALREIHLGEWEGQSMADIHRHFPEKYQNRGQDLAGFRTPGGESFQDLQARAVPAFLDILQNTEGHLLVIAHAGVNRAILCHLLGRPLEELFQVPQAFGCLNLITLRDNHLAVETINQPLNLMLSQKL
jgi:probable phosphoglycerate mutase